MQITPWISVDHPREEDEQPIRRGPLPTPASTSNASTIQSLWKQKVRMVASANVTSNPPKETSPIAKFLLSSTHVTTNDNHQKTVANSDPSKPTGEAFKNLVEQLTTKTLFSHILTDRSIISDSDFPKAADPEHQTRRNINMLPMPASYNIQRKTIETFERHASASIHENATECLREASFLKRKSWLKQVELSKEMVKQRAKRQIQQPDEEQRNSTIFPMRTTSATTASLCANRFSRSKVN